MRSIDRFVRRTFVVVCSVVGRGEVEREDYVYRSSGRD